MLDRRHHTGPYLEACGDFRNLLVQAFPFTGIQPAIDEISSGIGKVGLDFQNIRKTLRRLFVTLQLEQSQGPMMECPDITRSRRQHAFVAEQRLVQPLERRQGITPIVQGFRKIRFERERLVIARQRLNNASTECGLTVSALPIWCSASSHWPRWR